MATRTLTVKLVGDSKKLDRAFSNVGSKMAGLGRSAGKLGLALGGVFVGAVAAATPLVKKASDLNEEISKSEAVFGEAANAARWFGEDAAHNIGLSETAALDALNRFGQLGKAGGLAGGELFDFSSSLAVLAADLASFNNISVEEAAQKLQSGLAGETEPLKQLGIFFNAAAVEAKGLELGLGDLEGKLSDQEKIIARQALIFEQTADAQGDFAKTSDGLANKTRILGAQFENLQARLGQKFLPIALQVGDAMLRFVDFIGPKLEPIFDGIAKAVLMVSSAFKLGGLSGVGKLLVAQAGNAWEKLKGWIGETTPKVIAKVKEWAPPFFEWVKGAFAVLLVKAKLGLGKLTAWIQNDGLTKISDKLIEWGEAFVRWIAPFIPPLLEELGKLALAILEWLATDVAPKLLDAMFELGKDAGKALAQGMADWLAGFNPLQGIGGRSDVFDSLAFDRIADTGDSTSRSAPRGGGPSGDRSIFDSFGAGPSSGPRLPCGTSRSGGASAGDIVLMIDSKEVARATRDGSHKLGGLDIKVRQPR